MVKTVSSTGVERLYSYPVCSKYTGLSTLPGVYLTNATSTKMYENPVDGTSKLYANVGYKFDISLAGSSEQAGNYSAKLVIYNQNNGAGVMHTANQQIGPLVAQLPYR